jgi:hypothetical protein
VSVVQYRIWGAIAGVVALAGMVNFFGWAARYDGAIVIPFLLIGGLALSWWYRRMLAERLTHGQSSATARLLAGQSPDELGCAGAILGAAIVICGWLWARLANSYFQASAGGRRIADSAEHAVLHRWIVEIPGLVTVVCLALYAIAIIVVAAKRRRLDLVLASIGYVMCLGFCVLTWVVMLEFEVFD